MGNPPQINAEILLELDLENFHNNGSQNVRFQTYLRCAKPNLHMTMNGILNVFHKSLIDFVKRDVGFEAFTAVTMKYAVF
jgi:hypothetical protein